LHRWDSTGKLTATFRTAGKHRRYVTRVLVAWLAGNRQEKSNKGKQENNSGNKRQKRVLPQRVLIYAREKRDTRSRVFTGTPLQGSTTAARDC